MANRKVYDNLYCCIGENFNKPAKMGYCGDVKSLRDWLLILTHKDWEFLDDFFHYESESCIVRYIYLSYGKRLKKGENSNG